jgi:hypothetical protein
VTFGVRVRFMAASRPMLVAVEMARAPYQSRAAVSPGLVYRWMQWDTPSFNWLPVVSTAVEHRKLRLVGTRLTHNAHDGLARGKRKMA